MSSQMSPFGTKQKITMLVTPPVTYTITVQLKHWFGPTVETGHILVRGRLFLIVFRQGVRTSCYTSENNLVRINKLSSVVSSQGTLKVR